MPQAIVLGRPEPALWPLAMLMAGAMLATVEEVAGRLARTPELPAAERRELLGLAAVATADAATLRAVVAHLAVDSPAQVRRRLGLP